MKRRLFQGLVAFIGASRPPMPCLEPRQTPQWASKMERFNKQSGLTLCVSETPVACTCCFFSRACLFVSYHSHRWLIVGIHLSHRNAHTTAHTQTHSGLSPAVTPHSRQMGDICSLEIFLHYCHRGTSLNVCFPAPVLMRTCLLKWWSTWQRTFTQRHAPTDHMCGSVLSSRASRVMSARCTTFAAQNKVNSRLLCSPVVPDIVHSIHRANIYIG